MSPLFDGLEQLTDTDVNDALLSPLPHMGTGGVQSGPLSPLISLDTSTQPRAGVNAQQQQQQHQVLARPDPVYIQHGSDNAHAVPTSAISHAADTDVTAMDDRADASVSGTPGFTHPHASQLFGRLS